MKLSIIFGLALVASGTAAAQCGPPQLVWFSPEDGATGVVTDAVLVAVAGGGLPVQVELDGKVLSPLGTGLDAVRYEPGELDPNTTYEVEVTLGNGPTVKTVRTSFTTGEGPAAGPPEAPEYQALDSLSTSDSECGQIRDAQACLDPESEYHAGLRVTGSPYAWVVTRLGDGQTVVWPGRCVPEAFANSDGEGGACFRISAMNQAGEVTAGSEECPFEGLGSDPPASGGRTTEGCQSGPVSTGSGLLLLGVLMTRCLALRRRSPNL